MQTQTKTKSTSKTKIIAATALLVGGVAAYAMATFSISSSTGYSDFFVQCHDGSTYTDNGTEAVMVRHGVTTYHPTAICQQTTYWRGTAQAFCEGSATGRNRKQGINTYQVSTRCDVVQHYGFGYGYGYMPNQTPDSSEPPTYGYDKGADTTKKATSITEKITHFFSKDKK